MEKLLIVSSDDYILYQPTILNLYDFLKEDFEVTIVSFQPEFLGKKKDTTRAVIYLSCPAFKKRMFRVVELCVNAVFKRIDKFLFRLPFRVQLVRSLKYRILSRQLAKYKASHVIAVDSMPLVAAQKVFGASHFLSLEIIPNDPYFKKIDKNRIQSVIIQNRERYNHLFDNLTLPTFYIQNAPRCANIFVNKGDRSGLIWAGSIVKEFAIFDCLDFIKGYPQFRISLKGGINKKTRRLLNRKYKDLLESGSVTINEEYLSAENFIKFISNFEIGFCFYGWQLIKTNFNYQSAPSGRLFMYLAAGVPVIACNITAFKLLEDNKAGVLINDYHPDTILRAIKKIQENYNEYRDNCYATATRFCFETNAFAFRDYLLKRNLENVGSQ